MHEQHDILVRLEHAFARPGYMADAFIWRPLKAPQPEPNPYQAPGGLIRIGPADT